jgi:hypothetical protein
VFRFIGRAFVVFAMFSLLGGHWAVLRSVAWTTMIVERSASLPMVEAIQDTFSGKSPCKMCKVIAEKRAHEKEAPLGLKLDKKLDPFLLSSRENLPRVPCGDRSYPRWKMEVTHGISQEPPTPVPILRSLA